MLVSALTVPFDGVGLLGLASPEAFALLENHRREVYALCVHAEPPAGFEGGDSRGPPSAAPMSKCGHATQLFLWRAAWPPEEGLGAF